jgi:hypothetical protein
MSERYLAQLTSTSMASADEASGVLLPPTAWLEDAAADFAGFVERRRTIRELWASR